MDYGNTAPREADMSPEVEQPRDEYGRFTYDKVGDGAVIEFSAHSTKVIPITERTMSDTFNPDDANAVSRFFQSIADKVVMASTLTKEVEELRAIVEKLKADVESYRENTQRLDEEVTRLRQERNELQARNNELANEISIEVREHQSTKMHLNNACSERDKWHNDYISLAQTNDETVRKCDDAQLKVMELEDALKRMAEDRDRWFNAAQVYSEQLQTIRNTLNVNL